MQSKVLGVFAALSLLAASASHGQGGRLDERTQYQMIHGVGMMTTGPLIAIVLWRGEPGWISPVNDDDRRRMDSTMYAVQLAANARDESIFGQGRAYGLKSRNYDAVTIEGQRFEITRRDSALIIMVSIPAGSAQRTVTTARISAESAPNLSAKQWMSGDTTFIVHVPYQRQVQMLRDYLQQSPTVAAFMR